MSQSHIIKALGSPTPQQRSARAYKVARELYVKLIQWRGKVPGPCAGMEPRECSLAIAVEKRTLSAIGGLTWVFALALRVHLDIHMLECQPVGTFRVGRGGLMHDECLLLMRREVLALHGTACDSVAAASMRRSKAVSDSSSADVAGNETVVPPGRDAARGRFTSSRSLLEPQPPAQPPPAAPLPE